MSYDPKCYDLAKDFLSDEPEQDTESARNELAQIIQDAVENFLAGKQGK